tara:strand:- start:20 stop:151 length:132 start_codon:yes stop_codon:yes gene_type:complete
MAAMAVPMKKQPTPKNNIRLPPYLSVDIPMNGDITALMMADML